MWTIRIETRDDILREQKEALLVDGDAHAVETRNETTTILLSLDAALDGLDAALRLTQHVLARLGAMPYRIVVESTDAPDDDLGVVATKALAGMLGVSEQRVRELAGKGREDFPTPYRIEGAAGMYFRRSEVEGYVRRRAAGG